MNIKETGHSILKTKQHFVILDGLRGIAALAVVIFHFTEWVYSDYSKNFIGHCFLAVDFFFCLSGFVIAYAYDDRIHKIGFLEFFKSRLIRLHPLVILGSILGLAGFLLDPFDGQFELYNGSKLILLLLCSIFLIPLPIMKERSFNLFSFNAPAWSLFWEYVANIFYAFILYQISRRYLLLITILAAVALCLVGYKAGNLLGGWGGASFWDGFARVAYSFSAGLLLFRSKWIINNKLGFIGLAILLSLSFIMPYFKWNAVAELIVVLFYFPLIVALGAGSTLSAGLQKICIFFGKISYPLYMTHYAAIWIFANYYNVHKPGASKLSFIIISVTILLLCFAYLVMVFYDEPLRKYLNKKRMSV